MPDETQPTKGQHYIPKFYLKGFTDKNGSLWVYERFKPLRESKPKLEAQRPDYYTHTEQGQRDESAEDVLEGIESRVAPIILKLANPQYVLKPENAALLIVFVGFMFVRVPSWRDYLDKIVGGLMKDNQLKIANDKERFHKLFESFQNSRGKSAGMDGEELRQVLLKGEFEIEQKSVAYNLGAMFRSGLAVIETLKGFGYEALFAPEGKFFMTSDSPVFTLQPDGKGQATINAGFGWPGVAVYFPLNKRACFRMRKGLEPRGRFIEEGHVDEINRVTMATASHFLYSSERYKRISRLFDERGCKTRPGDGSFMPRPPDNFRTI